MEDLKKRIQELTSELNKIHHSWTRVTAAMWTEEKWAEERARAEEIKKELTKLVPLRINELEEEWETLNNRYSMLTKIIYKVFKYPKFVGVDLQRMQDITREIQELQSYVK